MPTSLGWLPQYNSACGICIYKLNKAAALGPNKTTAKTRPEGGCILYILPTCYYIAKDIYINFEANLVIGIKHLAVHKNLEQCEERGCYSMIRRDISAS